MTKLEQVARAIDGCLGEIMAEFERNGGSWSDESVVRLARAAVEELREPTHSMCVAAWDAGTMTAPHIHNRVGYPAEWHAAIDAILNEKPDGWHRYLYAMHEFYGRVH
jgi:hypothetical protein